MSRHGFFAYGAGVAGITLLTVSTTIDSTVFVYRYAGGISALGVIGWLISSLGPIALSILVWVTDQRIKARWLPHLIFVPSAIIIFREGVSLYYRESGILADSMASGLALLTATGYLVLALLVHIVAFAAFGIASLGRWANDR
jgi:hypothetical protein